VILANTIDQIDPTVKCHLDSRAHELDRDETLRQVLQPVAALKAALTLILDMANDDVSATFGFESDDWDRDFQAVLEWGAVAIEPPANKAWGVRTAYFRGPGALKFEIGRVSGESIRGPILPANHAAKGRCLSLFERTW